MSLKPGIGAGAVEVVGAALEGKGGSSLMARERDVPSSLRYDGKRVPLGRYLRSKLRERMGMAKGCPDEVLGMVARNLRDSLMESGAREAREGKRVQDTRRASGFVKRVHSRKVL